MKVQLEMGRVELNNLIKYIRCEVESINKRDNEGFYDEHGTFKRAALKRKETYIAFLNGIGEEMW